MTNDSKNGHANKLSKSQAKALQVLTQGGTVDEAAEAAGVSERTVYRWKDTPAFSLALVEYVKDRQEAGEVDDILDEIYEHLLRGSNEGSEFLREVVTGEGSVNAKIRASSLLLQNLLRLRELIKVEAEINEIREEIEALRSGVDRAIR